MSARATRVPIVAYHSIADRHDHLLGYLSLSISTFERQLQYLQRKGFTTVSLYDIYEFLRAGTAVPARAVALTFDDGYLDNWVHVFPLLKKYGMKATLFVVTEFVDPRGRCRPTLDDVWAGTMAAADLDWWGHMSWAEIEAMQASGLVDVQAHTRTHTWHFVSDRIVDFHHPEDTYFWLDWNRTPAQKHSWLTRDFRASVPWGTPVYEHAQTLLQRRYVDDPEVTRRATEHVEAHGGRAFFARPAWRAELTSVVDAYRQTHAASGRLETGTEYRERVLDEMLSCKRDIAARLGKPVDFLCWPCGDYTAELQQLAIEECGYLATVNVNKVSNRAGDSPTELRRIVFGQDYTGPRQADLLLMHFAGNVRYHSGDRRAFPIAPIARRLMKLGRALSA
jgi:hypothetical protein